VETYGKDGAPALSVRVSAPAGVSAGTELSISYLGLFHYADAAARGTRLYFDKAFACECPRCADPPGGDSAGAVPCPTCHGRNLRGMLEEEVMFDDGSGGVKYAVPVPAQGKAEGVFHVGSLRCTACGMAHNSDSPDGRMALEVYRKVSGKVLDRLSSPQPADDEDAMDDGDDDGAASEEFDRDLLEMATLTLGSRHWTTSLLTLSILDRDLARYHSAMLTGRLPDSEELAGSIDDLQGLWKFADGLGLTGRCGGGALLYAQTLGICRVLVAMGDEKSVAYAKEWAGRVAVHVRTFEAGHWGKIVEGIEKAQGKDAGAGAMATVATDYDDMEMVDTDERPKKKKKKKKRK